MKKDFLKVTNLYQEAHRRKLELEEVLDTLQKRSAKYPEGKIHVICGKKRIQYYLRKKPSEKSGEYISKKQGRKIALYLQKRYDMEITRYLEQEIKNLSIFLEKTEGITEQIQNVYGQLPEEIKQLVQPLDIPEEDFVKAWLSVPFETKGVKDDGPLYITDNGEKVRSKSELNIANALYKHHIPYKYECPLTMKNGLMIFPDFTVLHPHKRKEFYWEHRGMMDDREYLKHTLLRIKEYERMDIYPGDGLILTEESSAIPLGTDEIERQIRHYFL